ncbi:MAG: GGDEF domain-containing protein [Gammaproteobacteria bacterium]
MAVFAARQLGTGALATLLLRPEPRLESSLLVVIFTLPVIIVHTMAVSVASYRLIRTVARQNRELEAMRRTDAQTGLAARSHWQEQASASLERFHASGEPACLLMIDIDHFKPINDVHGHTVGDEVIRAVGQVILDCVRAHDHAGRYGGDEFAVVCSGVHADEAQAIAERIRDRIAAVRLRELPELQLTSSIGLAETGRSHISLRDWINDADTALYRAKHGGRNQVAGSRAPMPPGMPTPPQPA